LAREMCIFSEKPRAPVLWPYPDTADRQLILGYQAFAATIPTRCRGLCRGQASPDRPAFDRRASLSAPQSRSFGKRPAQSGPARSRRHRQTATRAASVTHRRQASALILLTIPCIRERRALCRIVPFA